MTNFAEQYDDVGGESDVFGPPHMMEIYYGFVDPADIIMDYEKYQELMDIRRAK